MVRLEQVTRQFGGTTGVKALDAVTLTIARGEMTSIVGPSGSGKSTLLNLIAALDRPTAGSVCLDGIALADLADDALTRVRRDKVGIVFQFFNLLPSLTAVQNVALPLHLRGWSRGQAAARARELLSRVGLDDRRFHRPDELSGGQRQRVAIARALSIDPPLLLADEPTGNLDTRTGADILALLHDLHARTRCTVVIVTHDDHVARCCDRMVTLRDGRVVDDAWLARSAARLLAAR
ncbi:MAG: ABC transporter ATP-binding protein [Acidobacteria bacterium]|nr:ABC transporter ATP-binding protein [Acidobacteriota bacterium]